MIKLRINWASVLYYLSIISYGYFASMTMALSNIDDNLLLFLAQNALVIIVIFALWYFSSRPIYGYADSFTLRSNDALYVSLAAALILLIVHEDLTSSLVGDELAYTLVSFAYGEHISKIIAANGSWFDEYSMSDLVRGVYIFIFVLLSTFIFFVKKFKARYQILMILILVISARMIVSYIHGNEYPHPPLHLLPELLFGILFGIDDLTIKSSFFFMYAIFVWIMYSMLKRKFSPFISFWLMLVISTIPVFMYLSTRVEHAIWGGGFTILFVEILTADQINYKRMFAFLSIVSLMRMPVFLATFLLSINFLIFDSNKIIINKNNVYKLLTFIFPVLLFLPFLLNSIVLGTPSHQASSFIANILDSISSGAIFYSMLNSIDPVVMLMAAGILLCGMKRIVFFIISFLILFAVYHSIDPMHWGEYKYHAEYFVPFSVAGLIIATDRLLKMNIHDNIIVLILMILAMRNVVAYTDLCSKNVSVDSFVNDRIHSGYINNPSKKISYDYNSAYEYIVDKGIENKTYIAGVHYGAISELLSGYSVRDYMIASKIQNDVARLYNESAVQWTSGDADILNSNKDIRYILIGFVFPNKNQLISDLISLKWVVEADFVDPDCGSTIFLLKRSE